MPEKCDFCKKGDLEKTKTIRVGDTLYNILKCSNCKRQVARSI